MLKRALGVIVCVFLWTPGYAQTLGTITGEVKDTSGAVIPGATVTAQNVATNAVRIQNSNEAGAFTFPAMPPGDYTVKAELQGFKTAQNKVELHVEQSVRVSFTLEVGGITETTEVTGTSPLISDRERDDWHRHRQSPHRRTAAQRPQLPEPHRREPERQRRVRRCRAGRRSTGRLAFRPAVFDCRPAPGVQLLHAGWRG